MVPMLDPMVPEATVLLVVSPALVGVVTALLVAAGLAVVATARELAGPRPRRAGRSRAPRANAPAPLPV